MATAGKMKMVNGRVEERAAARAGRVLAESGLSISSFIRNSIEYIADHGAVPESGFPRKAGKMNTAELRSFIRDLESRPLPGKADFPDIDEDALVERLRMQRYGY